MCVILLGVVYRLGISVRAPVSYDEVFVMAVGLDEMRDSAGAFVIDVPLRRSNALVPMWWWAQAVPTLVAGEVSLVALRIVPLLLGAAALVLGYVLIARRFGRGPAAAFVAFAAASDVLAFTNARGEYAESLLILLLLPALGLVGARGRMGLKATLWGLMLLTHLGKGLFLVAALAAADGLLHTRTARRSTRAPCGDSGQSDSEARFGLRRTLATLAMALAPATIWMAIAATRGPMLTDIGEMNGPFHMLRALTLDYHRTKPHMMAGAWDALQIWRDPWVWPATLLSVPFLIAGACTALVSARGRRGFLAKVLAVWSLLGFALVVGRGLIGARFHLLYLPALWLLAGIGCGRIARGSWCRAAWRRMPAGLTAPLGLLLCGAAAMFALSRGPVRWAPFARFEPYKGSDELAAMEAHLRDSAPLPGDHGRTLYIDLANYFLLKPDPSETEVRKALHYAELEVARLPDDARAWFYLARARLAAGQPSALALEAARRSEELRPSAPAQALIRQLSD